MRLYFKQRFFSWFDSYDIYNEAGETEYVVRGELAWGKCLRIYDKNGYEMGLIKEKILTWFPKFEMYEGDTYVGSINKEFSFFSPKFNIDCNGWHVDGNFMEWDYSIFSEQGSLVANIYKEVWKWTDTYVLDIYDSRDALRVLMMTLAIDAEKASRDR